MGHDTGDGRTMRLAIEGMTCRSCEVKIERSLRQIPGVRSAEARAADGSATVVLADDASPSVEAFQAAVAEHGYALRVEGGDEDPASSRRPGILELIGLFVAVLVLGKVLAATGLLNLKTAIGEAAGFGAIFLLGLVAASSSCIAVAGGLLLATTARVRERYGMLPLRRRLTPVLLFVTGRVAGYGVLGGAIGALGSALTPSPVVAGMIAVVAAIVMLVAGLEMLHLAPRWLRRIMPRMPKGIAHRLYDAKGQEHPAVPFLLGAGTFFLPCGFTQSLQLAALASGSPMAGAAMLTAFALGTAPALIGLGLASTSLKGAFGRLFFRFSGALVVVLGLWNIQNGLAIAGVTMAFPRHPFPATPAIAEGPDPYVRMVGGRQTVVIDAQWSGYVPDRFTLRAGVPTVLKVSGEAAVGCASVFVIPRMGVQARVRPDAPTDIAFTPTAPGSYAFSCSMGMLRGTFDVVNG